MRALLVRSLFGAVFYGVAGSLTGVMVVMVTFGDWSKIVEDWPLVVLALVPFVLATAINGVVPAAITGSIMGATLLRGQQGHARKLFGGALVGAACSAAYCAVAHAPDLFEGREPFVMPNGSALLGVYVYAGAVAGALCTWLYRFTPEGRAATSQPAEKQE